MAFLAPLRFASLRRFLLRLLRGITTTTSPAQSNEVQYNMPPGHLAEIGHLTTFSLPERVTGSVTDRALGRALVDTWRKDGILQISMDATARAVSDEAFRSSRRFFSRPHSEKEQYLDSQSYSGYIASGEEITDGIADYSEVFTVTKEIPAGDPRAGWPCHGECPWPDAAMRAATRRYTDMLGRAGETILQLTELGLGVPAGSLTDYTEDGWHHLRILRFPACHDTNGRGREFRGIGAHTDYGLLVIAAQDHVGGLFVRPPRSGEHFANWEKSTAGMKEDDHGWVFVPPTPGVFTVFPGDMMQYMTGSYLPSTPHKVGLNTRERFAFAYFHEPSFQAVVRPLQGFEFGQSPRDGIHYGTHFTNMFMRNYPDRITTRRLIEEGRYRHLSEEALRTMGSHNQHAEGDKRISHNC